MAKPRTCFCCTLPQEEYDRLKGHYTAKKAWATRRANQEAEKRSAAARKAHRTRKEKSLELRAGRS